MRQPFSESQQQDSSPRGIASAVATVAALLLTLAVLASAPGGGFAALNHSRITFLGEASATAEAPAVHPVHPGSVAPQPTAPGVCMRAHLALRTGVMLAHTSLPPPLQV